MENTTKTLGGLIDIAGECLSDKAKIEILNEFKSERVEIQYYDCGKGLDEASEKRMVAKFAPKFANGYAIMRDRKLANWCKVLVIEYFFIGREDLERFRVENN